MLVTIIVPVYNVAKYIEECIQCVMKQTFEMWELLLIDDGSVDRSGAICDAFAAKDDRIIVIHKQNTGVSDTRNIGLDMARGKYVIFLDADDYWYDNSALDVLVCEAETNGADIVRGEYKAVKEDGSDLFVRPINKSKKILSRKVLDPGEFYTEILGGENFLVLSLINKESIGNLRFNKDRTFLEDMEFYAYLLLNPLRCMYIPLRFYAYRKIASSVSNTPKIKNLADGFSMCDVFDRCYSLVKNECLRKAYKHNRVMKYYLTLNNFISPVYYEDRNRIIEELSLTLLQKKVSEWAKESVLSYPIYVYLSPNISIWLLKNVNILKRPLINFKSVCKIFFQSCVMKDKADL